MRDLIKAGYLDSRRKWKEQEIRQILNIIKKVKFLVYLKLIKLKIYY